MKRVLLLNMVFVLGTLLMASWALKAAPQWKGEIKIGYTAGFLGSSNFNATTGRDGAKIAVKKINEAGGVLGRKLVFIVRDNECQVEKAVSQAKELCLQYAIDFALAPNRSADSRAVSAVYQRYKIPTMILCSMADEVMEMGNPYYVRLCYANALSGKAMASAVKRGNYKRPGLIYLNDFWGIDMRKTLHKEMEALGLKIVSEENFDMGTPDISPQVMKILAGNPDTILLAAYSGDAPTCIRTFKSQGYKGDYISYSGIYFNPAREAGGHDVDGIVFPIGYFCQGFYMWNRPGAIPLLLELEKLNPYGKFTHLNASPEIALLDGYQAIYALKEWIEKAGERGLKDKDYFMDVVAKSKVHSVIMDINFPYGRKKMEAVTDVDDLHMMKYVNGHLRVWEHEPRCIETFETTRIQAEEEVYSKGFTEGVTFRKYLARWQELLSQNKAKVLAEIDAKLQNGMIKADYANMFKKAVEEIVAYKF